MEVPKPSFLIIAWALRCIGCRMAAWFTSWGMTLTTMAPASGRFRSPPSGKPGEPPKRITRGVGWIWQLSASHDGKVLTFLRENSVSSAYLAALAPDGTQLLAHRRLTLDENENDPFAWTPDGKAVLFSSDRNGISAIFKQATDQPLAESLTTSAEQLKQPRVTPDGSEILYISTPKSAGLETPSSLFAMPIGGGAPRLVLKDVGIWNVQCANPPLNFCLYSVAKGETLKRSGLM